VIIYLVLLCAAIVVRHLDVLMTVATLLLLCDFFMFCTSMSFYMHCVGIVNFWILLSWGGQGCVAGTLW